MQVIKFIGLWLFIFWIVHQPRGHILINMIFGGRYSNYNINYRYKRPPSWIRYSVTAIELIIFLVTGILALHFIK